MLFFHCFLLHIYIFFFKQKTAYEMRTSDWSSDVCSSDLHQDDEAGGAAVTSFAPADSKRTLHRIDRSAPASENSCRPPRLPTVQIGRASCRARVCQYV